MTDHDHQLLAYVEGELEPTAAQRLRDQLSNEPQVLAALDAMRSDRARLRALGRVAPPIDFVGALEQQLARPMLMDADEMVDGRRIIRPGAYRRRAHRRRRYAQYARMAAAAGLVVTVGLALWAIADGMVQRGHTPDRITRVTPPHTDDAGESVDRAAATPSRDGVIVHLPPLEQLAAGPRPPAADPPSVFEPTPPIPMTGFALAFGSGDASGRVEQSLQSVIAAAGDRSAVVRNFTFAEAIELDQQQRLSQERGDTSRELVASAGPDSAATPTIARTPAALHALARRVGDRRVQMTGRSGHLAGSRAHAADAEQQLLFSEAGATHTMTVRLGDLDAVLVALRLEHHLDAKIAPLDDDSVSWLSAHTAFRRQIDSLRARFGDEAIILLPIVLEQQ